MDGIFASDFFVMVCRLAPPKPSGQSGIARSVTPKKWIAAHSPLLSVSQAKTRSIAESRFQTRHAPARLNRPAYSKKSALSFAFGPKLKAREPG